MKHQRLAATERTYLRPPRRHDMEEFTAASRRSEDLHDRLVSPPTSPEAFAAYLDAGERDDVARYLACRTEDDAIAGFVNLGSILRGPLQQAFVGYGAFVPHAGQGHLTEAVGLVVHLAFTSLRLHRLEANIQPGNVRSAAVADRCGFRLEGYSPNYLRVDGRWRDHERWAITVETWRARAHGG